jgi:hypothetical protein
MVHGMNVQNIPKNRPQYIPVPITRHRNYYMPANKQYNIYLLNTTSAPRIQQFITKLNSFVQHFAKVFNIDLNFAIARLLCSLK